MKQSVRTKYLLSMGIVAGLVVGTFTTTLKTSAQQYTNVYLTVSGGNVTIGSTGSFNLGTVTVSTSITTLENQFTGLNNEFFVQDLKGANSGYYTTISVTDLTGANGTIDNANIFLKVPATGAVLITGTANTKVVVGSGGFLLTYQPIDAPVTFLKRDTAVNSGVLGKYGTYPFLRVDVPAFQSAGDYTAIITYTLYEN